MRRFLKRCCVVSIVVICLFLNGCEKPEEDTFQEVSLENPEEKGISGEENSGETDSAETMGEKIFVHVCGEVNCPGVYELEAGSRIFEAINLAGGITKKAASDSINQAEVLMDGQQIYVPSKEETENQKNGLGSVDDGKVNINRASKEELMTLSGIGEAKADAIIRYRQEKGNFDAIEEIMEIEGIKEGVFRKIQDQITVS